MNKDLEFKIDCYNSLETKPTCANCLHCQYQAYGEWKGYYECTLTGEGMLVPSTHEVDLEMYLECYSD